MQRIEINAAPATVAQLHRAATVNYGHFTSMQVRGGAVRGLDLHLVRLAESSRELFGSAVSGVRELVRHALAGEPDAAVRVTVLGDAQVMVTVTDPVSEVPELPWRVRATGYVRDLPHVKHVATMGLIRHWRLARAAGFDDALFFDQDGLVSEGTAWNVVAWDGAGFVWPRAAQLVGITRQLLHAALPRIGVSSEVRPVHLDELAAFHGALASYSYCPSQPLASVDDVEFLRNDEAVEALQAAWDTVEWDQV